MCVCASVRACVSLCMWGPEDNTSGVVTQAHSPCFEEGSLTDLELISNARLALEIGQFQPPQHWDPRRSHQTKPVVV